MPNELLAKVARHAGGLNTLALASRNLNMVAHATNTTLRLFRRSINVSNYWPSRLPKYMDTAVRLPSQLPKGVVQNPSSVRSLLFEDVDVRDTGVGEGNLLHVVAQTAGTMHRLYARFDNLTGNGEILTTKMGFV
jgi:hypothetical protein